MLGRPELVRNVFFLFIVGIVIGFLASDSSSGETFEKREDAILYFSETLDATDSVSAVKIGLKTYHERNGSVSSEGTPVSEMLGFEVLRLAYARELALRKPVFSLGGSDIAVLQKEVSRLEDIAVRLAEKQGSIRERMLVARGLYPTDFLREVADLEEARRMFIHDTSWETYARYDASIARTLKVYEEALGSYLDAFSEVVREGFRYTVLDGTVDKVHTLRAGDSLLQNMREVESMRRERGKCIGGAVDACEADHLTLPSLETSGAAPLSVFLPSEVHEALRLRSAANAPIGSPQTTIFALDNPYCTRGLRHQSYVVLEEWPARETIPREKVNGWNQMFYNIEETKRERSSPVVEFLLERGLSFMPWNPMMFYVCPFVGNDYGALFSVREASIYMKLPSSSASNEVDVARALSEKIWETSPGPGRDAFIARAVMLADQSAGLENLVAHIAHIGQMELRMAELSIPIELAAQRLFTTQSGFPSLFLAYNNSVYPHGILSISDGHGSADLLERLHSWSDLQGSIPEQDIIENMRIMERFHNAPETLVEIGTSI